MGTSSKSGLYCTVQSFILQNNPIALQMKREITHTKHQPVVKKNIGALNVPVEKVFLMAVVQTSKELLHKGGNVFLTELHQARLQQTHQVMVHVLKH